MRTRDIKPDTQYATCDGRLVTVKANDDDVIHSNWYRVYDSKSDESKLVDGGDEGRVVQDPWGGCHTVKGIKQGPGRRRSKPGLLVDVWEFDGKGRVIGDEPAYPDVLMQPADIAGTWKEYLSLYADVVEARHREKIEKAAKESALAAIKSHLAGYYDVDEDQVGVYTSYRYQKGDYLRAEIKVLDEQPTSRKKNPPPIECLVADDLGLDYDHKDDL